MATSNTESFSQIFDRLKNQLDAKSDREQASTYFKLVVLMANIVNDKSLAPQYEKARQVLLKELGEA
jgi:hypothetical protein